eukprot:5268131-Prymnesium_polylepis.1
MEASEEDNALAIETRLHGGAQPLGAAGAFAARRDENREARLRLRVPAVEHEIVAHHVAHLDPGGRCRSGGVVLVRIFNQRRVGRRPEVRSGHMRT